LGIGPAGAAKAMPIEVAIAGEVSLDRAIALAEAHLGSLPPRQRISSATLADRRVATRAQRPPEVLELPDWKGPALVLVGFFGADIRDIGDHRALAVAARVMNGRLDRLPPEQHDAEQAFAMATPASVYPGFGLFLASTRAKEGSEAAAGENIGKLLADLMESGPSAEELSEASQELSNGATKATSDPVYWARTLSRSAYHGFPLAEIGRAPTAYREMPADAVKGALRKYFTPERSIRLIVKPPPTPSPAAPKAEAPAAR
jgi:predicted Zn-dependent peptidase